MTPDHDMQSFLNAIPEGVILFDISNYVLNVNASAEHLLRIRGQNYINQPASAIFENHPHVLSLYEALIREIEEGDRLDEAVLGDTQQRITYVEMRVSKLNTTSGEFGGYMMLLQDITARKHAEIMAARRLAELSALRSIDERITGTLDVEDVLQIALTSAQNMTGANAGFISLREDDQNQQVVAVSGGYPSTLINHLFEADMGIGGRALRFQQAQLVLNVAADPDYVPRLETTVAMMAIPLVTHERPIGLLMLETNIASNFKAETFEFAKTLAGRIAVAVENAQLYSVSQQQLSELQTLYEHVKHLEQEKTEIIRIAAHDLRNPVSTVMGFLDLLQIDRERLDEDHQMFVDTMMEQIQRMDNIIGDILSLERYKQGGRRIPIDLRRLVENMVNEHQGQAQLKNIALSESISTVPVMVSGDDIQLREAIANLIANAIKYTPDDGRVEVSLGHDGSQAIFQVSDTGYGIPEEMHSRLFQPFYRAVSPETQDIKGTGLGLHLVKSIIDRHDGRMIFQSVYHQGSIFGFEMPLMVEVE